MKLGIQLSATHVEVNAQACSTDRKDAFVIFDALAVTLAGTTLRKVLIEVGAPARSMWLLDHIDIWNRAIELKLTGARIAFVVRTSSLDRDLSFAEDYARNRGVILKFFTAKEEAMPWLLQADSATRAARNRGALLALGGAGFEAYSPEICSLVQAEGLR